MDSIKHQKIRHYWLGSLVCSSYTCTSSSSDCSDYFTCSSSLSINKLDNYLILRSSFLFISCIFSSYCLTFISFSFSTGTIGAITYFTAGSGCLVSSYSRSLEVYFWIYSCFWRIVIYWFLFLTICSYFSFSYWLDWLSLFLLNC